MKKSCVGVWNTISDLETLNMLAKNVDFIYVDLEHGLRDISTLTSSMMLLNALEVEYAIRVRSHNDPMIQTIADFGVKDIVVPGLRTRKEFQDFKQRLNLPPSGTRGVHPRSGFKANSVDQSDVAITVIIETKESLELIDYFVNDPQVETIYLGVYDLAKELQILDGPFSAGLERYFQQISQLCVEKDKSFAAILPPDSTVSDFGLKGVNKILLGIDLVLLQRSIAAFEIKGHTHL
jgi:4-hydroxy-2-oxoheptanedioate aldolase